MKPTNSLNVACNLAEFIADHVHEEYRVSLSSGFRWHMAEAIKNAINTVLDMEASQDWSKYSSKSTEGLPEVTLTEGVPGVRVNGKDPNAPVFQTPAEVAAAFITPYLEAATGTLQASTLDMAPTLTPVTTVFEPTPVVMNPPFAPAPPVPMNQPSNAEKVAAAEAFKRGRGRPKGAKNKRKKAKGIKTTIGVPPTTATAS